MSNELSRTRLATLGSSRLPLGSLSAASRLPLHTSAALRKFGKFRLLSATLGSSRLLSAPLGNSRLLSATLTATETDGSISDVSLS